MRNLLSLAALSILIATPALAASDQEGGRHPHGPSRVHVYSAGHYGRGTGNNNLNPDFQLGGDNWKRSRRHVSATTSNGVQYGGEAASPYAPGQQRWKTQ